MIMETTKVRKSKLLCHIHDEVKAHEIDVIRENVCVSNLESPLILLDGKHYCLFHLPTKDKDTKKFDQIFHKRIDKLERETKKLISDSSELPQNQNANNEIQHDFRYVWFPKYVTFPIKIVTNLEKPEEESHIITPSFQVKVNFRSTTFADTADFQNNTFHKDADFSHANFLGYVQFSNAEFEGESKFYKSVFFDYSGFHSTLFKNKADFDSAIFGEKSEISFDQTIFTSGLSLYGAKVEGYLVFEGVKFPDKELIFENTRIINPERVFFNSMTLQPSYFTVDTRMFVFNDVDWKETDIDITREKLDEEIDNLSEHNIKRPKESLIKTLNQLADNAESNRRFELAKLFRKQSIALQDKQCHIHFEVDSSKKDDIRKNVCRDYPIINEDGGNHYCLWHNPDKNKAEIFIREFEKRQKEGQTDFRAVIFPTSIEYTGKLPDELNFSGATFYRRVFFDNAEINNLNFNEAYFTDISELVIKNSVCRGKINFDKANVEGKVFLNGKKVFLNGKNERILFTNSANALSLKDARIEKPHWINFRSIRLLPHYFVDVDASKFVFLDCKWRDATGKDFVIAEEITRATHKEIAQTCNQLAANYEENRHYDESSDFRYGAMEAKRFGYKSTFTKIFNLYWLYKWTSGYGESRLWATFVLLFLIGLFSVFYATHFASFDYGANPPKPAETFVGQSCDKMRVIGNPNGMTVCDGIVHSLAVTSFQRPDPKPNDALTKLLVTLETILVPIQAALLALAIRRKFMR